MIDSVCLGAGRGMTIFEYLWMTYWAIGHLRGEYYSTIANSSLFIDLLLWDYLMGLQSIYMSILDFNINQIRKGADAKE